MVSSPRLVELGILLFTAIVFFQLITLPVEFNASRRAVAVLGDEAILTADELVGTKKVLSAAALTYVAAAVTAVFQLLRLLIISGVLGGRDELRITPALWRQRLFIRVLEEGAFANLCLDKALFACRELSVRDRGFATELVYGTIRQKGALDWYLDQFAKTKTAKINPWLDGLYCV